MRFFNTNDFVANSFADKVFSAFEKTDLLTIVDSIKYLVSHSVKGITHPIHNSVITYCRGSFEKERANFIVFSDENNNNFWTIIQIRNAVDCIFFGDEIYQFPFALEKNTLEHYVDVGISTAYDLSQKREKKEFKGFLLAAANPFHFFYDRYTNLFLFDIFSEFNKLELFYSQYDMYTDVSEQFKHKAPIPLEYSKLSEGCYLHPNTINGRLHCIKNPAGFNQLSNIMENMLVSNSEIKRPIGNYDLVLWFGITGTKRRWVEQVEGYQLICNQLAAKYGAVLVYIDGMTNCNGRTESFEEDIDVFNDLLGGFSPNVTAISLIGSTYTEKIAHCKNIDAYIANAGTGSLVPAKFCKKNGILHGSTRLFAFPDLDLPGARYIPKNEIKDVFEGDESMKGSLEHWSYSISPEFVNGLFNEIINQVLTKKTESV